MEEIIRAMARPVISIMFAIIMGVSVVYEITLPEWFLGLSIPVISWWFVERTVTHAKATNSASIDKLAEKVAEKIKE